MSLTGDIVQAYRAPSKAMHIQIERGITEPQTLFYGMLFGVLNLVSNYPRVSLTAPDQDTLTGMMAGLFIAYVFFLPLMLYGLAAVIHWVVQKFDGQATWGEARRALNWSAVVTSPLILISGILSLFENNIISQSFNVIIAMVFIWQLYYNFKKIEFN
jgi:hypothetical protein